MTLQAATWKDKITDSSNYWLGAIRLEEDGRLSEAAVLYLKDAAEALKQGLRARAALSCSCAASCLEKTGKMNAARNLYLVPTFRTSSGASALPALLTGAVRAAEVC